MKNEGKWWDKIAEKYARSPVKDEVSYQKKLQTTREYFTPDTKILEFGCGTGSTAIAHAPYVKHVHATDISAKMLEIAQCKTDAAGIENITYEHVSIEDFTAPGQSYDMILGLSLLHLVEDREAAIAKIHSLLKPGGLFVSSTVCLGDKMKYFKIIAPIGKFFGFMPLLKIFTTQNFLLSIADADFTIEHQWQPNGGMSIFVVARKPG